MKDLWNKRYSTETYAYGTEPNTFFKEQLFNIEAGKILLAAEGEGRNAVFAAKQRWDVLAFDISDAGKAKAERLAKMNKVKIEYRVADLSELVLEETSFDAIGLIYAHFPAVKKSTYHKALDSYLKKGGIVIFEAFSKSHLKLNETNDKPMGPANMDMLFSMEEVKRDFSNYEIILLEEKEIELSEGSFHHGKGSVIRFVGMKK